MTPEERDRLVTLKKAKKKLIKKQEAAEELGVSVRHVRRLLVRLKKEGDKSVIHALKGKPSHRRIAEDSEKEAVKILSAAVYRGFGPTLASEYLRDEHGIEASKETVRQWMIRGKLWRAQREKVAEVHTWRPRRSRFGELVQWDTSEHDWLEGRGERLYLIAMIDDATSRLLARFARHDSTEENMRLLWSYLEKFGRPRLFYTDKASLFQTAEKRRRDEPGVDKDPVEMPPTQIGRALRELGIGWSAARSPQAKGRIERTFGTAQDRLVKGLRKAEARTLEQANQYLEQHYLVWWKAEMTAEPSSPDDAHRALEQSHVLAASLSHVETRQVRNDYTLRWDGKLYQIERSAVSPGLRGTQVRIERRLDGSLAVRHGARYLAMKECAEPFRVGRPAQPTSPTPTRRRGSDWNKNFDLHKAPKLWQAAEASGCRPEIVE
ncbi:MAG: ISNCY family transposase [Bryobacterales bacterium]|nr:ISNCY family transposase [Bryobacterales bacterium]